MPYDILVHQALSITKGYSGISLSELVYQLKENVAFNQIEISEIEEILNHLIAINLLEKLQHEVIIGIEGEKIVNSRDFYSVFKTEENFKVVNAGNKIGEIPFSPQIIEDANILLSARIWKIKDIDYKAKRIEVIPANDGKPPIFFGGGAAIHPKIREKMLEILYSEVEYDFLDQPCYDEIETLRKYFSVFVVQNTEIDRPLLVTDKQIQLFTFTGTRINNTIKLLFDIAGIKNSVDENSSSLYIKAESKQELFFKWDSLSIPLIGIDEHIANVMIKNPALLDFSKWGMYLPIKYKIKLVKNRYYDTEQTKQLLETMKLIQPTYQD
jgi:ATP-dependent Lhr-like helicase